MSVIFDGGDISERLLWTPKTFFPVNSEIKEDGEEVLGTNPAQAHAGPYLRNQEFAVWC